MARRRENRSRRRATLEIAEGELVIRVPVRVVEVPVGQPSDLPSLLGLTPRQIQVFELMRRGLAAKEVAAKLGMSLRTAKFHWSETLHRLGLASRSELLRRFPAPFE